MSATSATDSIGAAQLQDVGGTDVHGEPKSEADWPHPVYTIVVDAPDTAGNFTLFNIPCDVLDSDFLMQPVNEADYDSETQACVDRREGTHSSFYDHYVTKRKKKKGLRNCGIESPAPRSRGGEVRAGTSGEEPPQPATNGGSSVVIPATSAEVTAGPSAKREALSRIDHCAAQTGGLAPTILSPAPQVERAPPDSSFLMAPSLAGGTSGVGKGALSNAAIRRMACGRMPPPPAPPHAPPAERFDV